MTYLVGVAGISGSGKSTVTEIMAMYLRKWGLTVSILHTDDAYEDLSDLTEEQRADLCTNIERNYDHPDLVQFGLLNERAKKAKAGEGVEYTGYNKETHGYKGGPKKELPENQDVVFVEGIYALFRGTQEEPNDQAAELQEQYDWRLFVDTREGLAFERRLNRDKQIREEEQIRQHYNTTVKPMQDKYILRTKENANDTIYWEVPSANNSRDILEQLDDIAYQHALTIYQKVTGISLKPRLSLEEIARETGFNGA